MRHLSKRNLASTAATGAVVAACWAIWEISAYHVGTQLMRALYFSSPFLVFLVAPLLAAVGLLAAAASVNRRRDYLPYREDNKETRQRRDRLQKGVVVLLVASIVVPLLWFVQGVRWSNRYGYETAAPYTVRLADVRDATAPSYAARLSIPQARLQLRQALSGAAGSIGDVTYVANQETPEYCATVLRAATLGRVWTREILCLDPSTGRTRSAAFTGNVGSPEGLWSSKLGDQVASVQRGLVFDQDDVYGYITEDGAARLVVPVRQATGDWNRRYDIPAGVVVFEADGGRRHFTRVAAGEIPGPVMPMGVAARVRDSVNSQEGFLVHRSPRRSEDSLERTNTAEGLPATDPNAENPSEFVLRRDDRLVYVTPLTPFGQSQTVVAYLEVVADEVVAGEMPEATLYRLARPQASLQLITQRVATLYDADIDWLTTNDAGDDANKARIYEVTPGATGQVTLTVGTGTQTLYRVYVDPVLDDQNRFGDICIHRFRTDERIRCDASDADPAPVGSLRGIAGSGTAPGVGPASGGVDLSKVATADLLAEIARRLGE